MAKTETQPDIKKCLMNLEAVESHIEKQKPNFSPKLAIGLSGWLSMLHGGLKENDIKTAIIWNEQELKSCEQFKAPKNSIALLNNLMIDNLPESPIKPLTQCVSALYIIAGFQEEMLGREAGVAIGERMGHETGQVVTDLTYLYKKLESENPQELFLRVNNDALILYDFFNRNGKSGFEKMKAQCSYFGIVPDDYLIPQ